MWNYSYRESFLKDLSKVQPKKTRERIEELVFQHIPGLENPFTYKGLTAMEGYHGFYKVRAGNFRIGVSIDQKTQHFEFCRLLHRKDIYKYFP